MEGLIVLLLLGLLVALALGPILAIVAVVRSRRQDRELSDVRKQLGALEARLEVLRRQLLPRGLGSESAAREAETAAAPVTVPEPAPAAALSRPPVPAPAPVPAAAAMSPPQRLEPAPALAPPAAGQARVPVPAATARRAEAPPALPPVAQPPRPATPPPPPGPAFDWESLLGLRGAAWAGGVALVVAGLLFAKLAIDRGFFTPELRVVAMLLAGVGALVGAEGARARGYATSAHAVAGAGIAVLYACFFAAHSLYGLFPLGLTFGLMVLVTIVACLLSIRHDAFFVAVLGLLGGFATPLALSTGQDKPVGLFSYLLLLNVGLVAVALRKRWHGLVLLALGGTFLIQVGWFARFMAPEKMLVGVLAFLLFGLLYLFLPALAGDEESQLLTRTGALGGVLPFLFAFLLAAQPRFAGEWPLLFGFLGILGAALVFVALRRDELSLLIGGSLATAVTLPLWGTQGLRVGALWGPVLGTLALVALYNLPRRLDAWLPVAGAPQRRAVLEVSGLLPAAGAGLFGMVLLARDLGEPPWAFLLLSLGLLLVLLERTRPGALPAVGAPGAVALALMAQAWFFRSTEGEHLLRNLAVPVLLALLLSVAAGLRATRPRVPSARVEDELGVIGATLVAVAGLFICLASGPLSSDAWPLYAALAVADVLLVVSALRRDWPPVVLLALAASSGLVSAWQAARLQADDLPIALPWNLAFYLAFLALPFALAPRLAPSWRRSLWPWLASALSGVVFFPALHQVLVTGWGNAAIGLLPLGMAALSVLGLSGVLRRFPPAPARDEAAQRRRLDLLALFAALALGFVALAIPLQLDRQWVTVAWALEALAVWWLLERLPHGGLRLFGALLYAAVAARLLLNWDNLLHYQARGLPIFNWLLYTYGVPALCCLLGARCLRRSDEAGRLQPWRWLAPAASLLGLVLIFALVNLEIADYFSSGPWIQVDFERRYTRDLVTSTAWGLYAIALLAVGVWRGLRALRMVALGFLVLTVLKVFLYDLSALSGFYRVLSFLGLGVALILVSLVYQRFVVGEGRR